MITFGNNLLAAMDVETTGLLCGYHEIVQVSIVVLDQNMDPMKDLNPFYMEIKPQHPERVDLQALRVNGLSLKHLLTCREQDTVADLFSEWGDSLQLNQGQKLIPLTHNGPFDTPRMQHWLGIPGYLDRFTRNGRDSMYTALAINDRAAWKCRPIPFDSVGLGALAAYFGIPHDNAHDALADCLTTAKVYKELLRMEQ